jgi:hypothetical protein
LHPIISEKHEKRAQKTILNLELPKGDMMNLEIQSPNPEPRQLSARIWLVVAYIIFAIYAVGQMGLLTFWKDATVGNYQVVEVSLEEMIIVIGFITLYGIVTTLPMLLIISYQRHQLVTLKTKIREDLWLCGLDSRQLHSKMKAFMNKNSWGAFVLPTVLTLIYLGIMWSYFLLPEGPSGLIDDSSNIVIPDMLEKIANKASVISLTFLGAYFYILMVLIRRWMQADLTTGVLWRINIRLAVSFLIGFLLFSVEVGNLSLGIVGFLAGIVPDTVLRWLSQQARSVFSSGDGKLGKLFKPSDLQEKIDGPNFWQVDRLLEEGIESVQDMAVKEIPDLLINTRFDTAQILYWVDQALLCNQAGGNTFLLHDAYIKTASDLLELAEREDEGLEDLLRAIQDGQQVKSKEVADESDNEYPVITLPLLKNIVGALSNVPNLPYATEYWYNTNTPRRRADRLAQLQSVSTGGNPH